MNWVQKLIAQTCRKFGISNRTDDPGFDGFQIGAYRIRVVEDDPTFTIKIIDLERLSLPKQINNIYWDDLASSLEETVKSIR